VRSNYSLNLSAGLSGSARTSSSHAPATGYAERCASERTVGQMLGLSKSKQVVVVLLAMLVVIACIRLVDQPYFHSSFAVLWYVAAALAFFDRPTPAVMNAGGELSAQGRRIAPARGLRRKPWLGLGFLYIATSDAILAAAGLGVIQLEPKWSEAVLDTSSLVLFIVIVALTAQEFTEA